MTQGGKEENFYRGGTEEERGRWERVESRRELRMDADGKKILPQRWGRCAEKES